MNIVSAAQLAYIKGFNIQPVMDRTPLTVISHTHKFIYIGIPKVGTRSFMQYFTQDHKDAMDVEWFETAAGFSKALEAYPDYTRFSLTRNPWARVVSCYNSKVKYHTFNKYVRVMSKYQNLKPEMPFEEFVKWLASEEGADSYADRHWLSMYHFLYDGDEPLCQHIGKFEERENVLPEISKALGIETIELPHKGWVNQNTDYRSYYTDETKAIVAERYARDIKLFGYEF